MGPSAGPCADRQLTAFQDRPAEHLLVLHASQSLIFRNWHWLPPVWTARYQKAINLIYTDWANHYLAKSGCPRLIKDLSQDVTDGVLLAQIIQIIANEKVEDINGSPRSQSQMEDIQTKS
ncbi:Neuron navigator 3 [Takifugu flavidus]|uniref:Neuron navigator 3 n=1 Tax=Takifugu flavidus TaxID=433684 RepID=A0A5C6NCR7_9TELE|nr:Neuron navigator 3 [Takifugu flavidus]